MMTVGVFVGIVLLGCAGGCSSKSEPPTPDATPSIPADKSTVSATPRRVLANGRSRAKVTVRLADEAGPIANEAVSLSSTATATFSPPDGVTDANGVLVTTMTSTTVGPHTITATAGERVASTMVELTVPCEAPLFGGPPYTPLRSATAADLNGDGVLDLVGVGASGGLGFASGNGDGSFQSVELTASAMGMAPPIVGDFNKDGYPDVAGIAPNTPGATLLLGRGDGTFMPEAAFTLSSSPRGVQRGDFDHDGNLDLASIGLTADGITIGVLFGNGDGTFQPETQVLAATTSNNLVSILAVDLDGDQDDDLVTAELYTTSITVHVSTGNRAFLPPVIVPLTGSAGVGAMAATDLDGNGKADVALARYLSGGLTVLLGKGDTTFEAQRDFNAGVQGAAITATDVDHDGKKDLIMGDTLSLHILRGDGTGDVGAATSIPTPRSAGPVHLSFATGDFDADAKIDLAVSGDATLLARGDGSGTFNVPAFTTAPGTSIAAADFDGDTKLDVAIVMAATNTLVVRRGIGDGTFEVGTSYSTGTNPSSVRAARIDGDGSIDLIVANELDVTVLKNNGAGVFAVSTVLTIPAMNRHRGFAIDDFNNDDKLDIAITREPWFPIAPMLTIALGVGDGTFGTATEYTIPDESYIWFLATGDLRGNGIVDILTFPLRRYAGVGNGTFTNGAWSFDGGSVSQGGLVLHDMDGDTKLDLLATSTALQMHRGLGDGTFAAPTTLVDSYVVGNPVAVGKLNADNHLDIVTVTEAGIGVVVGRGGGVFGSPWIYPTSSAGPMYSDRPSLADLNGDGLLDLVAPGGVLLQQACIP